MKTNAQDLRMTGVFYRLASCVKAGKDRPLSKQTPSLIRESCQSVVLLEVLQCLKD
jgi:hypothetical protein